MSEKKVIVYKIFLPRQFTMNKQSDSSYMGKQSWITEKIKLSDMGYISGLMDETFGFMVSYQTLIQINDNGIKYFTIKNDKPHVQVGSIVGNSVNIIDYTPEREEYFKALKMSTFELVKKITTFLGDGEQLANLIDSGTAQKLLG